MCSLVGLEVRGLGVHFLAAREETLMDAPLGVRGSVRRPLVDPDANASHSQGQTAIAAVVAGLERQGGGEGDVLWHL